MILESDSEIIGTILWFILKAGDGRVLGQPGKLQKDSGWKMAED